MRSCPTCPTAPNARSQSMARCAVVTATSSLSGMPPRVLRSRVHVQAAGPVGVPERCGAGLQPSGQTYRQRYDRGLQRQAEGGVPQRKLVLVLEDAREKIESWRWHYNGERPHSALGNLAPETFALVATAGLILRALVISVVLEANTYYVRDQLIEAGIPHIGSLQAQRAARTR